MVGIGGITPVGVGGNAVEDPTPTTTESELVGGVILVSAGNGISIGIAGVIDGTGGKGTEKAGTEGISGKFAEI